MRRVLTVLAVLVVLVVALAAARPFFAKLKWKYMVGVERVPVYLDDYRLAAGLDDAGRSISVYWVGHSLMDGVDPHTPGATNVIATVGRFAAARGLGYRAFSHSLPGAPLSLNWQGKTVDVGWTDGRALSLREELQQNGDQYDVLILTEAIGLQRTLNREQSAKFGRRFYCQADRARTAGRVYFYPTWHHFYASDPTMGYPPRSEWNWRARLDQDRAHWRNLAAAIEADGQHLNECHTAAPVVTLPIDNALAALDDALRKEDGRFGELRIEDFFANPLKPGEAPATEKLGQPVQAGEPLDDIHASGMGIYLVALTVFSAIYQESPIGLPALNGVDPVTAGALQTLVHDLLQREDVAGELERALE